MDQDQIQSPSELDANSAEARPSRCFEDLPAAAQRALREAEERRVAIDAAAKLPAEKGGRGGKEPVRYGDWEVKGLAIDF